MTWPILDWKRPDHATRFSFEDDLHVLGAEKSPVVLGALLGISGSWSLVRSIVGALPLAVEKVNEDSTLLPGRTLQFRWRDSGCSAADALLGLGSLTTGGIDGVIGPACSVACEPTAYLTAGLCETVLFFINRSLSVILPVICFPLKG